MVVGGLPTTSASTRWCWGQGLPHGRGAPTLYKVGVSPTPPAGSQSEQLSHPPDPPIDFDESLQVGGGRGCHLAFCLSRQSPFFPASGESPRKAVVGAHDAVRAPNLPSGGRCPRGAGRFAHPPAAVPADRPELDSQSHLKGRLTISM